MELRRFIAFATIGLVGITSSGCSPQSAGQATVLVLTNDKVQRVIADVAVSAGLLLFERAAAAVSSPAHAEALPGSKAGRAETSPAATPVASVPIDKETAERLAFAAAKTSVDRFGFSQDANGALTFTCDLGEQEVACIERLKTRFLATAEGRASALAEAFAQCQRQASRSAIEDVVKMTQSLNECMWTGGFSAEVAILDPGFVKTRGS